MKSFNSKLYSSKEIVETITDTSLDHLYSHRDIKQYIFELCLRYEWIVHRPLTYNDICSVQNVIIKILESNLPLR